MPVCVTNKNEGEGSESEATITFIWQPLLKSDGLQKKVASLQQLSNLRTADFLSRAHAFGREPNALPNAVID